MRDEELQTLRLVRAELCDLKTFGGRRRVADQHGVESRRFVRACKRREEVGVDAAADDVYGRLGRRRDADHSDDVDRHGGRLMRWACSAA